jgi:hypothetical protein
MKKYKKIPHVGSVMTAFPHFADTDAGVAELAFNHILSVDGPTVD